MEDERVLEDIVTNFLLTTCRLRPECSVIAVQAAMHCARLSSENPRLIAEYFCPLTTGSVAEFYVEPMLPHIGDIDVMFHLSTDLAIPRGHPPPTQLPAEFHSEVRVYEIIDSSFTGYVYLEMRYILTGDVDEDCYEAKDCHVKTYLENTCYGGQNNTHGPAVLQIQPKSVVSRCDLVRCVPCLTWPTQAAEWPMRSRKYGWPDSATVDHIVRNGCDVVPVPHHLYRQHNTMGECHCQWRLSFSRAEIVLINSWMPVQQIIYHMLRDFTKTERLTDSDDSGSGASKLSSYHIKTLMLWACELKPRNWWTDDISLVRICVELLHDLAVWLTEARCPHYFITNCSLLDSSYNMQMIQSRLSISKRWLLSWFANNYIRRCAQLCPHNVSRLFDDVRDTVKMQYVVSAVVNWRLDTTQRDMFTAYNFANYKVACMVSDRGLTLRSTSCYMNELRKINTSLPVYFLSVALLHIARRTSRSGLNDELMDVLAALVGQPVAPRRCSSRRSSVLLLSKAVNLMKAVDDRHKSLSTVQLIAIELSKAYLYRALKCEDYDSDSIYCLTNVYLAVLYYTTGQYQTAIDHCTLVMRSQDHSQCSSHVVQGELLPKTDNDIDSVLGLAVFYQHVRMTALNEQQQTYVTVFTTELFAHYLHIRCLSITKCQQLSGTTISQSSTPDVSSYVKCINNMQRLFIADVLLYSLLNLLSGDKVFYKRRPEKSHFPSTCPSELNTSELVELLHKSAVEYFTKFRQIEARDFASIATIVTTDLEALYAYKHGDYQQCLQLSTQNVHTLLEAVDMLIVTTVPEFIQLLDDEIVSVTALTLIINPKCRDCAGNVSISQLTLSLYLMAQCQLKLRYSMTPVAQTSKHIAVARGKCKVGWTLNKLVLTMIAHKTLRYVREPTAVRAKCLRSTHLLTSHVRAHDTTTSGTAQITPPGTNPLAVACSSVHARHSTGVSEIQLPADIRCCCWSPLTLCRHHEDAGAISPSINSLKLNVFRSCFSITDEEQFATTDHNRLRTTDIPASMGGSRGPVPAYSKPYTRVALHKPTRSIQVKPIVFRVAETRGVNAADSAARLKIGGQVKIARARTSRRAMRERCPSIIDSNTDVPDTYPQRPSTLIITCHVTESREGE